VSSTWKERKELDGEMICSYFAFLCNSLSTTTSICYKCIFNHFTLSLCEIANRKIELPLQTSFSFVSLGKRERVLDTSSFASPSLISYQDEREEAEWNRKVKLPTSQKINSVGDVCNNVQSQQCK
jgi:hypothetical protein